MKPIIFRRLKVLNLLKQRAYLNNDFDKFERFDKRIQLIECYFNDNLIVNR